MALKRISNIALLLLIAVSSAMGVPARRGAIIRTAPDGTEKAVYLHGNAFSHFMTDKDGNWLDETTLEPMSEEAKAARIERNAKRSQMRRVQQAERVGVKPNLAPHGLLILVNFQNKAFVTPYDTMYNMLNGTYFTRNYEYTYKYQDALGRTKTKTEKVSSVGSAWRYFFDQSYGQYSPKFDIMGPFTLSKEYSYYGKNDDANAGKMIKEACEMANAAGADFTLYDNDNDGKVDFVYVIYAGYGEADGGPEETVWPHNFSLEYYPGLSCTVDGKKVANYACSNEISYFSNLYNGIGTFCHEFSHVLGLPDLYETNDDPHFLDLHTLFDWDILDYGPYNNDGNTPPAYSAYERFYMGWLTPRVLKDPQSVWLSDLNWGNGDAILLCEGDQHNLTGYNPDPVVFYMLESRRLEGWDAYLPGPGMLITKVSYDARDWTRNEVNNAADKMGVNILEARPNASAYARATDTYPAGATEWTDFAGHEVTEIEFNNEYGYATFSYRGAPKEQGMERVNSEELIVKKILRDGQLIIVRGDQEYDILGRSL